MMLDDEKRIVMRERGDEPNAEGELTRGSGRASVAGIEWLSVIAKNGRCARSFSQIFIRTAVVQKHH